MMMNLKEKKKCSMISKLPKFKSKTSKKCKKISKKAPRTKQAVTLIGIKWQKIIMIKILI